jgi:hypothetical protein
MAVKRLFGKLFAAMKSGAVLRVECLHRNWFNFAKLRRFLSEAGFTGVTQCEPARSHHRFKMNINRTHRSWYSLYAEAIRP